MRAIDSMQVEYLLSKLASAPKRIEDALSRLEDTWSRRQDAKIVMVEVMGELGRWGHLGILAHLRATNAINEGYIFAVLLQDNPGLPAYNTEQWAYTARYREIPYTWSLDRSRWQRKELITALSAIAEEDWRRVGCHEELGQLTLADLILGLVEHEDWVLAQIETCIHKLQIV